MRNLEQLCKNNSYSYLSVCKDPVNQLVRLHGYWLSTYLNFWRDSSPKNMAQDMLSYLVADSFDVQVSNRQKPYTGGDG
jgi:hypothetical protein